MIRFRVTFQNTQLLVRIAYIRFPAFLLSSSKKPWCSMLKARMHVSGSTLWGSSRSWRKLRNLRLSRPFCLLWIGKHDLQEYMLVDVLDLQNLQKFSPGRDLAQHSVPRFWTTQKNLKETWWVWIHWRRHNQEENLQWVIILQLQKSQSLNPKPCSGNKFNYSILYDS